MNTNGTIELLDDLIDLTRVTKVSTPYDRNPIRSYADLFSREEPEKIKEKNVLLTVEAILNPETVKSFLQKEPDAQFSIFIREVVGQALYKESSMILTHLQTADEESTMFVLINEFLNLQWFTTLDEKKFNTYLKELRRFNGEKIPTQIEAAFSTN